MFNLARQDRVISEAPTDDWEIKKGQTPEPDPYTEEERDKVLLSLERWPIAWRYFLMAFHSGMRTGELLGLEWRALSNPYCKGDQARVRGRITTTKTNKVRQIILAPVVWDMLDENTTKFKRSFVFLSPEGHSFKDAKWLMDKWDKAHKLAGVRKRTGPYPWRHTYISLALSKGATLLWISKQAGHNMVTMQDKYARWIKGREDADKEELRKLYE